MPAAMAWRTNGFIWPNGRFVMSVLLSVRPVLAVVLLSSGASAFTVTETVDSPISNFKSSARRSPVLSVMPERFSVLKPADSTVIK